MMYLAHIDFMPAQDLYDNDCSAGTDTILMSADFNNYTTFNDNRGKRWYGNNLFDITEIHNTLL